MRVKEDDKVELGKEEQEKQPLKREEWESQE